MFSAACNKLSLALQEEISVKLWAYFSLKLVC